MCQCKKQTILYDFEFVAMFAKTFDPKKIQKKKFKSIW